MTEAVFKAVIADGGGYDCVAGVTLANGETIDFIGREKHRLMEADIVTLGGEPVLKKRTQQRSKVSGDYDVPGFVYVALDDIQSVIMTDVNLVDPRAWRF